MEERTLNIDDSSSSQVGQVGHRAALELSHGPEDLLASGDTNDWATRSQHSESLLRLGKTGPQQSSKKTRWTNKLTASAELGWPTNVAFHKPFSRPPIYPFPYLAKVSCNVSKEAHKLH